MFAALLFAAVLLPSSADYTVSVVTEPSTGPFQLFSTVYFSCFVDPLPPEPVTYSWRNTDPYIGGISGQNFSGQNFSLYTHFYFGYQHFSWQFCEVYSNGSSVGIGNTLIENQGLISTQDPLAQSFSIGDPISLRVNFTDYYGYIQDLTWYHNGTEVESDCRVAPNNTELTIQYAIPSDAGVYQLKITSTYIAYGDYCDSFWLPLIENHAVHAPVTFMLAETGQEVQYDVAKAADVKNYYIASEEFNLQIVETFPTNLVENPFSYSNITWYHNGEAVDGEKVVGSASYQTGRIDVALTIHNATAEDTGVYEGTAYADTDDIYNSSICQFFERRRNMYREYLRYDLGLYTIQTFYISFSVGLYELPVVSVSAQSISLTAGETTLLTCTAEGGNPGTHTLTWTKNGEVLATGLNTLSTTSLANSFGEYVCNVQTVVVNTTITEDVYLLLEEKGPLQLQIELGVKCVLWMQNNAVHGSSLAVRDVIEDLCSCNIDPADLQDFTLSCSVSGSSMIVSGNLSYSDDRGEVTASDLIDMLQTWLLTSTQPSLSINEQTLSLSRSCPARANEDAFNMCFNEIAPPVSNSSDNTPPVTNPSGILVGSFIGGLCASLILAIVGFGIVICVVLKVRGNTDMAGHQTEVKVGQNTAYELTRYQTRETAITAEEPVYEVPQ